ncbi:Xre family transcriptional regulator [Acidovorax phage AP1]|nr:Xre family transcriptional regulator [Acidovorax phage AP1]
MNEELTPEQEGARLANLLGTRSKAQFAREHGVPGGASMLSQHLSGHRPIGLKAAAAYARGLGVPVEAFSPRLARQIEAATPQPIPEDRGFEVGELVVVPESGKGSLQSSKEKPDTVRIPHFDTGGAMGGGVVLKEQPGVIRSWEVSQEWAHKNLPYYTAMDNLSIVTGFGDSMLGMFNPGDPILVDRGITKCDVDGVYFFRVDGEGFIKRLQRIPGEGILVISENSKYRDWTIKPSMEFQVLGKVLTVWRSEQF